MDVCLHDKRVGSHLSDGFRNNRVSFGADDLTDGINGGRLQKTDVVANRASFEIERHLINRQTIQSQLS